MPERQTEYHRYYYLDRDKLFLPTLSLLIFLVLSLCLAMFFFLDPNWHPTHHGRIRGKGALWVNLFFLMASLPVWLRVPIAFTTLSQFIAYRIAMLVWMFDKRPDFAIGPQGIYGIDYYKYRHISWKMMDNLEVRTQSNKYTSTTSSQLTFISKKWDVDQPEKMAKVRAHKIVVRAYEGVSDQEIMDLAIQFCPALQINRVPHELA